MGSSDGSLIAAGEGYAGLALENLELPGGVSGRSLASHLFEPPFPGRHLSLYPVFGSVFRPGSA